jgi:molecular chaperone Hsp33
MNPQQVMTEILPFEFDVLSSNQVDFYCRCSKDTFISKLMTLGLKEITEMKAVGHNEIVCRYCNKHYQLTDSDFNLMREDLIAKNN